MGSSQSKPRSIKQLGVQICGARLGRRNKGWRKRRTVNDGSVSRSLDDIVSICLSIRISTRERGGRGGEGNGEGRRFPQTAPTTSVHEGGEEIGGRRRGSHGRDPRGSKGSMGFPPAAPCTPIHNGGNARPVNEQRVR